MKHLITPDELEQKLGTETIIADCRFTLGSPDTGRQEYEKGHIPGAIYVHLEEDLSDITEEHGGRHPLPDMDSFAVKAGEWGIDLTTEVVVYDDQNGAMASRLWWMLRYLGHEQVYVLNSSYSSWEKEEFPVDTTTPEPEKKIFTTELKPNMLVHIEEVKVALHDNKTKLMDARDYERYSGQKDEVDPQAGHIPGADHYFWGDVINSSNTWKTPQELKEHFQEIGKYEQVISYCGSGVTAAVNVLAMEEAGYDHARLYAGSWSDWSSYPDLPIEKSENK